jgi:hypothetical protein
MEIVNTKRELKRVLKEHGLTSTPLPSLPVTIGNLTIECGHERFDSPRSAGKGMTDWYDTCKLCGKRRWVRYDKHNHIVHGPWY